MTALLIEKSLSQLIVENSELRKCLADQIKIEFDGERLSGTLKGHSGNTLTAAIIATGIDDKVAESDMKFMLVNGAMRQ